MRSGCDDEATQRFCGSSRRKSAIPTVGCRLSANRIFVAGQNRFVASSGRRCPVISSIIFMISACFMPMPFATVPSGSFMP